MKLGATVAGMAIAVAFVVHSVWSTPPPTTELPGSDRRAVTVADGEVPDGVTVLDDRYPGVARLNSALLNAFREAATGAAGEAIEVYVNSGWRSLAYQDLLLREAVSEYGLEHEAARWVATVDMSPHVSGDAVDVGSLMPRAGSRSMAPATGSARSTVTSRGTTNSDLRRPTRAVPPRTPTPPTTRGWVSD